MTDDRFDSATDGEVPVVTSDLYARNSNAIVRQALSELRDLQSRINSADAQGELDLYRRRHAAALQRLIDTPAYDIDLIRGKINIVRANFDMTSGVNYKILVSAIEDLEVGGGDSRKTLRERLRS